MGVEQVSLTEKLQIQKEELERLTDELEAERALLKTVLEQMPAGVIIAKAPLGEFILVNRKVERILRHSVPLADHTEHCSYFKGFHPDGRPLSPQEYPMTRCIRAGEIIKQEEIDILRGDGSGGTMQVSAAPVRDRLGRIIAGVTICYDITERKQAEKNLKDSEERYRRLVELSPDAILVHANGRYVFANPAAVRLFGADSPEMLLGQSVFDLIHPDYREIARKRIEVALTGQPTELSESRILRLDGQPIDIEVTGVAIIYQGEPAVQVVMRDITERKKNEEDLKRAEEKYRSIFENAVEGIFQSTPEGRLLSVNPALANMHGYTSPEDMITDIMDVGRQVFVSPQEREEFKLELEESGVIRGREYQVYRKDGSTFCVSVNARAVRDDSDTLSYYEGFIQDITERKRGKA